MAKNTLSYIYHFLVADPVNNFASIMNILIMAMHYHVRFAENIMESLQLDDVKDELTSEQNNTIKTIGENFNELIEQNIYMNTDGLKVFESLCDIEGLSNQARSYALLYRGSAYLYNAKYSKALDDFNCAIDFYPDNFTAIGRRGLTHRRLKHYEEALRDLNKAIEFDREFMHEGLKEVGLILQTQKKYREAASYFIDALIAHPACSHCWSALAKTYVVLHPRSHIPSLLYKVQVPNIDTAEVIACRADAIVRIGFYKEALADFSRAIELDDKNARYFAHRGEAHRILKYYKEALADFDAAITIDNNISWNFAHRGLTYHDMGCYEEALVDFAQAIALDSKYAWCYYLCSETNRILGRYEEALKNIDEAIELGPKNANYIARRGEIRKHMKHYNEAIDDLDSAIKLNRKFHWAYEQKGIILRIIGRYDEALRSFSRAEKTDPKCPTCIAQQALTYREMGIYDIALKEFERAISLDKQNTYYVIEHGKTYFGMQRYNEALTDLDRVITLEPNNLNAIRLRNEIYRKINRIDDLLSSLTYMIELNSDDLAPAYTERGYIYLSLCHYDKAMSDFDEAIKLDKDNINAIIGRKEAKKQLFRYEEALIDLDLAISLDDTIDHANLEERGLLLSYIGRYNEAILAFERVFKDNPNNYASIYNIAITMTKWKGYSAARPHIEQARAVLLTLNTENEAAKLYGMGGLEAVYGNTEQALAYLQRALLVEKRIAYWAEHDIAWSNLRTDPQFQSLLANAA